MKLQPSRFAVVLLALAGACSERIGASYDHVGSSTGSGSTQAEPAVPLATEANPAPGVVLVWKPKSLVVKAGETPEIEAELVNEGTSPVTLVLPGDGSDVGWRTPIVRWAVQEEVSTAPLTFETNRAGLCGNINSPNLAEVFTLAAGEKRALGDWFRGPALDQAGRFRIVCEYENDPEREVQGEFASDSAQRDEVRSAFAKTTRCRVRSEPIVLVVMP